MVVEVLRCSVPLFSFLGGYRMKGFFHAIRQVFEGTRAIDEKRKYQVVSFLLGCIHIIFMLNFSVLHINVLFIYNLVIVFYYMSLSIIIGITKRYTLILLSAFFEILFHSIFASLLLGWNWGFMIYTIGLIPVPFYICYTLPHLKQNVLFPAVTSLIVSVCYLIVKEITDKIDHLLTHHVPPHQVDYFYSLNTVLVFLFLWGISILFALQIRFMQKSLESKNESLEKIAMYDPLTHLMNRRSMNEYLKESYQLARTGAEPFCVIMADIDDFKKVNDTYGHGTGDEVLIQIARIFSENIREDDFVCRWGGEEILVLVRTEKDIALQIARRIRQDVEKLVITCDSIHLSVTVTLGVVQYQPGDSIRTVIDKADKRLYRGKKTGKNCVVSY